MSTQTNQVPTQTAEEKRDEDAILAVIAALAPMTEQKSEQFVFPLRRVGKLGLRALLDGYDKINPDLNQSMKTTDAVSVLQNIRDKANEDGWADDENASVLNDGRASLVFKKIVDACRTAYADEMALLVRRALSHISPVVNPQARAGSPTAPSAPSRPVPSSDLGYDFYKLQNQGQPMSVEMRPPADYIYKITDTICGDPPHLPLLGSIEKKLDIESQDKRSPRHEMLSVFSRVGTAAAIRMSGPMGEGVLKYLVNSNEGDQIQAVDTVTGDPICVGAKLVQVLAFFEAVRRTAEEGGASPEQTLKFLTRVWNVNLSKAIETKRCSLTQACIHTQANGLELPVMPPRDDPKPRGGSGGRGGGGRGGGGSSNRGGGSGSRRRVEKSDTDNSDSDDDAYFKRRNSDKSRSGGGSVAKPAKNKGASKGGSKGKSKEPEEYDSDWGGSKISTLACFNIVNRGFCDKKHCDFSHRPSLCAKVKAEQDDEKAKKRDKSKSASKKRVHSDSDESE